MMMTVDTISRSISTKICDQAGIELGTPGCAGRHASVARHVTECATLSRNIELKMGFIFDRTPNILVPFKFVWQLFILIIINNPL